MKLLREPLMHFLLIGAAIYALYLTCGTSAESEPDNTITMTAGEMDWLTTAWQKRWNRPPTAKERDGLIKQHIRESVLYREALAMGLDRDDVIIRRRMAQKLEFLAQDLVALIPPTDEDLQAYFAEHRENYQNPNLFTITQIFFDPDKRGNDTLDDAEKIKATLIAQADAFDSAAVLGDVFMLQNYYPEHSQLDIQKLFGSGFAEAVTDLATGQWHGPVLSGYGVHLVFVHSRSEPPPPVFAEVRERVAQDWEDDKRQELNKQYYESLLARYKIVVEDDRPEVTLAALGEDAAQ